MTEDPLVTVARLREAVSAILQTVRDLDRDIEHQMAAAATRQSAEYVTASMPGAIPIRPRKYQQRGVLDLLEDAISRVTVAGFWAEFGVNQGHTLRFIADRTAMTVHGFDAFEGLPEDWYPGYGKGHFDLGGALPELGDRSNVQIHKGWFAETVPTFAASVEGPAAFLHIDSDLYSSARTVLEGLADRIVPGTIIVFDEYLNYPGWQQHEFKAWKEFCAARAIRYRYLAFAPAAQPVSVIVEAVG